MLTLALVAVLAQVEEPSPPPLVPVEPGAVEATPPREPLYVPPERYEPRDPDVVQTERAEAARAAMDPNASSFSFARVAAVGGVTAGIGALLVGGALSLMINTRDPNAPLVLLLSLPSSLFLATGVGFAVHRALGGQGGYGSHLGGGAIGGAMGLLLAAAVMSLERGSPGVSASIGTVFAMSLLFGAGTSLLSELSNFRTLREQGVAVSVAPVQGGAVAMAGFRF